MPHCSITADNLTAASNSFAVTGRAATQLLPAAAQLDEYESNAGDWILRRATGARHLSHVPARMPALQVLGLGVLRQAMKTLT